MHKDDKDPLKNQLTTLAVAVMTIKGWHGDKSEGYDRVLAHLEDELLQATILVKQHRENRLANKASTQVEDRRAAFKVVK